jgi:hypothetical protein
MGEAKIDLKKGVYAPGEEVTGSVSFFLKKPVSQRGAALSLIGKERTEVSYATGGGKGAQSHTAVEELEFLHQDFPLPALPVDEKGKFRPGDYNIPFRFTLPEVAPITYRGRHAIISYQIAAKIDVPLGVDIRESAEFEVISTAGNPISRPVDACSNSWNSTNDPGTDFTLERCEYRRGEVVSGNLAFRNPDSKNLRKANVSLRWIEMARAQGHAATTEVLKQAADVPIGSRLMKGDSSFSIQIPQDAPLTFESSLSNVRCTLSVNLDIAMGSDVTAIQDIKVLGAEVYGENIPSYLPDRASAAARGIPERAYQPEYADRPENLAQARRGASAYCPYCGGVLTASDSKFCPHCGAEMP